MGNPTILSHRGFEQDRLIMATDNIERHSFNEKVEGIDRSMDATFACRAMTATTVKPVRGSSRNSQDL
jgi:hypothetical protein